MLFRSKTDPWDDKVHMLNAKRYAPMNARDKMPFEVTPIFYKLQRYDLASNEPAQTAPAGGAPPAPGDQPSAPPAAPPEGQPAQGNAPAPAADQQQPAAAAQNPPVKKAREKPIAVTRSAVCCA